MSQKSNVQSAIQQAASRFAQEIISLLRGATITDIFEITGRSGAATAAAEMVAVPARAPRPRAKKAAAKGGRGRKAAAPRKRTTAHALATAPVAKTRRGRSAANHKRSPDEVNALARRVLEFLSESKLELGVSAIAENLKVKSADLALPLNKLRREGRIASMGQKRATVYRVS